MKHLLLVALLAITSFSAKSQPPSTLNVTNNIGCNIMVNIRCMGLVNGLCRDIGGGSVPLAPTGNILLTAPTGTVEVEISVIVDPGTANVTIGVVGATGACGGWPTKDSDPVCGGITVETGWITGGNYWLNIHP